jgi:class 3 adenylate cyclase/tetratricopeptide (TPR) repeat protein
MSVCPICGEALPGEFPFCPYCGEPLGEPAPLGHREERKVVTVLFCDLVGFTARAERLDPEDVRAVLGPYHARLRAELERFGGTVEKFIGDAVMAVFGAPVAHEDDPERAVRAALAIRDWAEAEDVQLRIGINTGEALVTVGAEPLAAGDVVNTAARLEAAAPTGGILVGETAYRATRAAIEYREHQAVEAKGKAEPVSVWEALEAKARVKVEREARAQLVGRRQELTLLRETFVRVEREHEPQLVTLVGTPGIGKSRLVYELFKVLEQRQELVYWRLGRSLPYGEGVAFWALAEMVKAQAGILETDDAVQAEAKLRAAVEAVVGQEDPDRLVRHLSPLAGLDADGSVEDRRTEAFAAWRRFLESLAEQRPLVLVFEDLHWADEALLDFVDHLVDWARGVPLLVLATARPELLEKRPGWGGGKPNAATLSLSPLTDDETAELVHSLLESPVLPTDTRAGLLARAGGNPLYAEEFARLVAEGRSPDDLPESVQGLIAARLDGLADEEKNLLRGAAVVGRVFWLGSAAELAGMPRPTVEERLHALERKEFVRRERRSSVAGEEEYTFRHLLVRDVAYAQIPRGERSEKHRIAAGWIGSLGRPEEHAEMLAHHYLSALELARAAGREEESLVEQALVATRLAGDRAYGLNAFPAAARYYSRALEMSPPDDPEHAGLLFRLGGALHQTGAEPAERILEEASRELVAAGSVGHAAEAHVFLCQLWWDRGNRDRSFEQLALARALLGDDESEAKALVLARLARMHMLAGEDTLALERGREALALAERLDLDHGRSDALTTIGSARCALGDPDGIDDLERGLEIALRTGSYLAATAYNNLGVEYMIAGDLRHARELRVEGLRAAERFGDVRTHRFLHGCMIQHAYWDGRWEQSLREADAFVAECEAGSPHYLESSARVARALIGLAAGMDEAAAADARRAVERARRSKDPQIVMPCLAACLRVEVELGELDRASAIAAELLGNEIELSWMPSTVELAWAADRLRTADVTRGWTARAVTKSKWNDAALAILDGELERAADLFAEIGSLPDEARARLRAGDPVNVVKALEFYRSVDAARYVREGEALLAA